MKRFTNRKIKHVGFAFFKLIVTLCLLNSCKDKNVALESGISVQSPNLQSYIDSCSVLYLAAINEVKQGVDKDSVGDKYRERIKKLHRMLGDSFDSITQAYMSKSISQTEYDKIRSSLFTDSVAKRSRELSQLGVNIDLK